MIDSNLIHMFLSSCKSHIYEIHASIAAILTVVIMSFLKMPIKSKILEIADHIYQDNKMKISKYLLIKRMNLIVILCTMIISLIIFPIIAFISPLIVFSMKTCILTWIFSLAIYAVYDQLIN